MRGTLLKNKFSNSVFVGVKVGDSVTLRNHIFDKLTGSSLYRCLEHSLNGLVCYLNFKISIN